MSFTLWALQDWERNHLQCERKSSIKLTKLSPYDKNNMSTLYGIHSVPAAFNSHNKYYMALGRLFPSLQLKKHGNSETVFI